MTLPVRYVEPIYRPPSEAHSLILQATIGCSNLVVREDRSSETGYRVKRGCAFCVAYQRKRFRLRPHEELLEEIDRVVALRPPVRRIFLADGDALVLKTPKLLEILKRLYEGLPTLERVTSYASPKNLLRKKVSELAELRKAGLTMVYVGVESGDDKTLKRIDKRSTAADMVEACRKAKDAGIALSLTVILGLAGPKGSQKHAEATAEVLSKIQPEFAAALTLMLEHRVPSFEQVVDDPDFRLLSIRETLEECRHLVAGLETQGTVFRSNHASNWLALKGQLMADKPKLLATIDAALSDPDSPLLRPDYYRAL